MTDAQLDETTKTLMAAVQAYYAVERLVGDLPPRKDAMSNPTHLQIQETPTSPTRRALHHFCPGDVVEGCETGRLYLVIHGPVGHGHRVVVLGDGDNGWTLGSARGTFRTVDSAQLVIRRDRR